MREELPFCPINYLIQMCLSALEVERQIVGSQKYLQTLTDINRTEVTDSLFYRTGPSTTGGLTPVLRS